MTEHDNELRAAWAEVVATARRTAAEGLVVGTSGNVSARVGDLVVITPSSVRYEDLGPDDLLAVDLDGVTRAGRLRPSSELPLHLAVYRATDARAIVHTHAPHATAVSTLVEELPPVHYICGALGGIIRVASYATYGSPELAEAALTALRDRTGCLLRNHGTVVYADTLATAYDNSAQLEWMCRVWLAAAAVGTPSLLPPEEIALAGEMLRAGGQPKT
ncbi:class II aldolase/adducin family protein [Streptomyces sp. SL13]|uniref:Class II aldolase/adducin family protein n=1 Tax=Streptantibioticus silvisoli TaxID=2705255 RepID=A0AA90HE38_9ACTN|nr:class II aldolase/adducin family protein [Streptantibioticus silvisoli]MDI5963103.1 class II aldolase/adducin family protein [Streptantibioticus silvisoli]MDI5973207.1 class II aldolase/adducin family protein [Streptantibioticus silvisoli]